jgi:hypothetical protein
MTRIICAVTLMFFGMISTVNAAQQPQTKARTEQEKREADAAEYMRRIATLGGKMIHLNDEEEKRPEKKDRPNLIDNPTKQTDIRARL